jgi:voltage-gated potassium channel Kch
MAQDRTIQASDDDTVAHAIVAGFGVPGRAVADALVAKGIPFCVIELNTATVRRCETIVSILEGDASDPGVLRRACIERAALLVVAVPDDKVAVEITRVARQLNARMRIITRCAYTSAGMEAIRAGASQIVIAEQAVARELAGAVQAMESDNSPSPQI